MRKVICVLKLICAAFVILSIGCARYPDNAQLVNGLSKTGYRYNVIRPQPRNDRPYVLLAFSGGGTRAAAFSFGLLEALESIEYTASNGSKRRLLDDVEIISSVSGGSFTSAYYSLFPSCFFDDFPKKFLYRNVQKDLFWQLFNPYNWLRLASPNFSRIDLADEYYNDNVFEGKTFADLINNPKGRVPFLVLNATDISIAHRFEFTQDQFDLLCSDLSSVTLSRAVAASSNFPVAFTPLTLNNYPLDQKKNQCKPPEWIQLVMEDNKASPKRRVSEAATANSYRNPDRPFIHLLDGGLSDNLGLRGPFDALTTTDSPWSILKQTNLKQIEKLIVISANAKTTKHRSWDKMSSPPGIKDVLDVILSGPMDDVSFDSIEMVDDHFKQMKQLSDTISSCNLLIKDCPNATEIDIPFIATDFTFTELTFDDISDTHLRQCMQELPTTFSLPEETINLLRIVARYLLMTSDEFITGMKRIDPAWQPQKIIIDSNLIDRVCGTGAVANDEG